MQKQKPRTPGFRGAKDNAQNSADMWPQSKPSEDIGSKIKDYIKDINKLIDGGMGPTGDG